MTVQEQTLVWRKSVKVFEVQHHCTARAMLTLPVNNYRHIVPLSWELIFSFDTSRVIETGSSTFCFLPVCERFRFLLFPRRPQLAVKYKILALCCLPPIWLPQHTAPVSSQQQRKLWPKYSWQRKIKIALWVWCLHSNHPGRWPSLHGNHIIANTVSPHSPTAHCFHVMHTQHSPHFAFSCILHLNTLNSPKWVLTLK